MHGISIETETINTQKRRKIPTKNVLFSFAIVVDPCCQTEITKLNIQLIAQKEITQLQVAVDDLRFMQVQYSRRDLVHKEPDFWLCQHSPSFVQFHERL